MPPFEVGLPRAIGAVTADIARKASTTTNAAPASTTPSASAAAAASRSTVATTDALEPGQPPVDADRVAQIRKAVETGSYPLVPARIADAMIAAGMFLRSSNA